MDEDDRLAGRFEASRPRLRAMAYRMLGSLSDAEDAVQEGWLHAAGSDAAAVANLEGWFTTIVARVSLDVLRSRKSRREEPLDPDDAAVSGPEQEAMLADSVGLALLVVLDTLSPTERLAFVLHDVFAVPFEEIARILDRSPAAAKQLASRARRRLGRAAPAPDADLARQREIVDAFLAAAREGDFGALLAVLDPDVVLRADAGAGPLGPSRLVHGSRAVAGQTLGFARFARFARPVLVNGTPGLIAAPDGQPISVLGMTIRGDKIVEIDVLADPDRLRRLDLTVLDG
jgi:RNA polymerase sigma factor (sigma-70 family)